MEIFEIHITGNDHIHYVANSYGIKTIKLDLLRPNGSVIKTEHMTSFVGEYNNLWECVNSVAGLRDLLNKNGCEVARVKIECPVSYDKYLDVSLYIETHFNQMGIASIYPASKNKEKESVTGTDRAYGVKNYPKFKEKWHNQILELCLYDTFVKQDEDWFKEWEMKNE